jgi:hypothetical protein
MWQLLVRRPGRTVLALALLSAAAGCGVGKGTVHGKVTYKGAPLPGGQITFMPEKEGVHGMTAEIDPKDGTYKAVDVPTGPVKVVVKSFEAPSRPPMMPPGAAGAGGKIGPPKDTMPEGVTNPYEKAFGAEGAKYVNIPGAYQTPEATPLRYTVKGGEQEHNIDLSETPPSPP